MDLALLIARLIFGLGLAAHGAQKLLGWYGGYGIKGTGEFMASMGWTAGVEMAVLAGLGELGGGLLLALGLGGPIGPALMMSVMTVAMITVHMKNGFFSSKNGVELPLMFAAGALVFAFVGFGYYSVDGLVGTFGINWTVGITWIVVLVGIGGGVGVAMIRKPTKN